MPLEGFRNRLLVALPRAAIVALAGHAEKVALARGTLLLEAGLSTSHVHFLDNGLLSLVKVTSEGRSAEVGFIGIEGAIGVEQVLGFERVGFDGVIQIEGRGWRIPAQKLSEIAKENEEVRILLMRQFAYGVTVISQLAACNRLHSLRQRCCRWILTARDNVQEDTFALTHEFLALMLGVNRSTLSLTLGALESRKIIHYRRASLTILKRDGLEDGACECYSYLQRECERIFQS